MVVSATGWFGVRRRRADRNPGGRGAGGGELAAVRRRGRGAAAEHGVGHGGHQRYPRARPAPAAGACRAGPSFSESKNSLMASSPLTITAGASAELLAPELEASAWSPRPETRRSRRRSGPDRGQYVGGRGDRAGQMSPRSPCRSPGERRCDGAEFDALDREQTTADLQFAGGRLQRVKWSSCWKRL